MQRILSSTEQVKKYLPANVSYTFENLKPHLERAFRNIVLKNLTTAQYVAMLAVLGQEPAEAATDAEKNKYALCQDLRQMAELATVHLGFMYYLPFGQVSITDTGVQVTSSEHRKTAAQWQVEKLEKSSQAAGYEALEYMLALLDENRSAFPEWADSPAAKAYERLFIRSTDDFEQYQPLNGSRLLFRSLAAYMHQVELLRTGQMLGTELTAKLRAFGVSGAADETEKEFLSDLLPLVKGAIAARALAEGILRNAVVLSENGALQLNIRNLETGKVGAKDSTLVIQRNQYLETAAQYELQIRELIAAQAPEPEVGPLYDNTAESGLFHL